MNMYENMPHDHIVQRLENLAEHRTPAVIKGVIAPTVPYPIGEHLLLREVAKRLSRMHKDIEELQTNQSVSEFMQCK